MVEEPGRLPRMERKIDKIDSDLTRWRVQSEHRFTKLETRARVTALVWGFGAGLAGSIITAWLSKHV